MGAGSGRGCHAAGDAGTWSPHGGSSLPRSARGRAASRGTARGWAEASAARGGVSRPAREVGRRARVGSLARWAGFGRRARSEAAAREGEKSFSKYNFQGIFKCHLSNIILSKKMASFENVPKMKVD